MPNSRRSRAAKSSTGHLARENIQAIVNLEERLEQEIPASGRIADAISGFAGSLGFVVLHLAWFAGWIAINLGLIGIVAPFDPFPFQLLNVTVSLEAILLSTFVLMKQNRMGARADRRAHLDLQVNLLAEKESTKALELLDIISRRLGLPSDDPEVQELKQTTAVDELAAELEKKLGDH